MNGKSSTSKTNELPYPLTQGTSAPTNLFTAKPASPYQNTVKFSVGAKMLFSITGLLIFLGAAIDISTIFLLRDDKKNYTFQTQSSEAYLAGKSLVKSFQSGIDFLKLSLSLVDPTKPLTIQEMNTLQSITVRQSTLVGMKILSYSSDSSSFSQLSTHWNSELVENLGLNKDNLTVSEETILSNLPNIQKNGYFIYNLSSLEEKGVIALLATDVDPGKANKIIPISIGFIKIDDLAKGIKANQLSIATTNGHILFDTDSAYLAKNQNLDQDFLFHFANKNTASNGTTEFSSNNVKYLGSYIKPGLDLIVLSRTPVSKAMKATYVLTEKFIYLGFISIAIGIMFAIFFSKTLTSPILDLYEATKQVSKGKFGLKLAITSKDEIGSLADGFNTMSKEIDSLIVEKIKKIHLENEVEIASTVQQTLLPPSVVESNLFNLRGHYQSASQCGGDWWGYFEHDQKLYLMIADATGHGLPSALITASARSCFSVIQKLIQDQIIPAMSASSMLKVANQVVHDASKGKIMMTMFLSIIDFKTNTMTYSNAGHNAPWLFCKNDNNKMKTLHLPGMRLGEDLKSIFKEKTIEVEQDDVLFLYTDGLLDGTNGQGESFGKKAIKTSVEKSIASGNVSRIISNVVFAFNKHNGSKSYDDDLTIVVAELKKKVA